MTEDEAHEIGVRLWREACERHGLPYDIQDPSVVARAADFLRHSSIPRGRASSAPTGSDTTRATRSRPESEDDG